MQIEDYINRKDLHDRLDGDMELFIELTDIFLTDSDNLMQAIQTALDNGDAQQIQKSAHTLKGAVANFSAKEAYEKSLEIENNGRSGEIDTAKKNFEALQTIIAETKEALSLLTKEESLI